ncbi:UPF0545 protein C22orf39 homolog [Daktulosphaira vitifoliae]|uniref:UPF0545 protein C22orf39 homolog n=1 Tax=Daktulosphaira vitifoliae TaxID=58002 RepID=UPI0021AA4F6C|nr:UPF0545 protein C22orf39 homolog [Daktulosphaira vitifoliae]
MIDEASEDVKSLDTWMIRPCDIYNSEYKECTSIMSRLHQLFIFGNTIDCSQWHKDYQDCYKWKSKKDIKAAESLVQSEKNRRNNRWKTFYANDIWETRTSPPENWNDPLPDYIANRNSTLKNDASKINQQSINEKFCVIM